MNELAGECAARGVRLSLNGHGLSGAVGQLWTAVLEHSRG